MKPISKSPERGTFQMEAAVKRAGENGEELDEQYLKYWEDSRQRHIQLAEDLAWQKNNMEYDLRSTAWILEKVRASDAYAQNLYAAMCNMRFLKLEVIPILTNDYWSCSWRHSGGIIADMRETGDYIDWYCSGMGGLSGDYDPDGIESFEEWQARTEFVPEGVVTDEIREDLERLGWTPREWDNDD